MAHFQDVYHTCDIGAVEASVPCVKGLVNCSLHRSTGNEIQSCPLKYGYDCFIKKMTSKLLKRYTFYRVSKSLKSRHACKQKKDAASLSVVVTFVSDDVVACSVSFLRRSH